MDMLVSTAWVAAGIGAADLKILDATSHPLDPARDASAEFAAGHLPGARFLDLAGLADADDPVPGQAPTAAGFARRLEELGIGEGDRILLYDDAPHHTAARAWWLFRLFGIGRVAIMDGGLARWRAEGRPLETGAATRPGGGGVTLERDPALVRSKAEMAALVAAGGAQIVDARSPQRFTGAEPDPRAGVSPGHIPGSRNLPYGRLFEADNGWKRGERLAAEFAHAGIDPAAPVVTTCGSGVTAAVLLFGLALLGQEEGAPFDGALYDGSWSEWGADPATPKAVGL